MEGHKVDRRCLNICQQVKWFFIESEMCCALAWFTSINVLTDMWLEVWPPIIMHDQFMSFILTRVSSDFRIMKGDNVIAKLWIWGNIEAILVCDMTKTVILPIWIFGVKSDDSILVVSCVFDGGKSVLNCFWECSKYQFCALKVEKKGMKMLFWLQSDVFTVFLPLVKTWWPRQEIRFVVCITWFMVKRKMILR